MAGDATSLGAWASTCAAAVLLAAAVLVRMRASVEERAPANAAPDDTAPYRAVAEPESFDTVRLDTPRVAPLTWGVVLAQVAGVFAVFAVANGRELFAGHAAMRAPGGPTYAQTVHQGFVEVSIAALLAIACVVAGHWLLRPRSSGGAAAGGARLAAVELTLLGFVAVALVSSAHRLGLYEEAYGFTVLRLGVRFFQVGIAGLLALTAAGCVARTWRGWGSGFAWSALAMAVAVGSFDADGWVACRNVERARTGAGLDFDYLGTLSADAWAAITPAGSPGGAVPLLGGPWRERTERTAAPLYDARTPARGFDVRGWRGIGAAVSRWSSGPARLPLFDF
jgi:hypothetical protein